MTDDDKKEPTPKPMFDAAAWEQRQQEHHRRFVELLAANKTALFDALAAAGIEIVDVMFEGHGDSGQIESIEARTIDRVVALPATHIEVAKTSWDNPEINRQIMTVREAIDYLVHEILRRTHDGWQNDDGAFGDFTFDVADRAITLDYNERYTDTKYSHHLF